MRVSHSSGNLWPEGAGAGLRPQPGPHSPAPGTVPAGPSPGRAAAVPPPVQVAAGPAPPAVLTGGADPVLDLASRALMAYRLPVAPELVDRVARLVRSWQGAEPPAAVASAAAWLLRAGQPLTRPAVARLLALARTPEAWSLQARLAHLAQALEAAASAAASSGDTSRAEALVNLARALRTWPAAPEHGPALPLPALLDAVRRQLAARPDPLRPEATRGPGTGPDAGSPRPEATPEPMTGPGTDPPHREATREPAAAPGAAPPRPTTSGARQGPVPAGVAAALEEVSGFLEVLRSQASTHRPADPEGWMVWPLPLPWPGESEPREVLLRYRRAPRPPATGDGDEVELHLSPPHLGPLAIRVRRTGGAVAVTVTAAEPASAAALAAALPDLRIALEGRRLRVGELAARAGAVAPPALLRPPEPRWPAGLDRRA